jgi:glycosyltransferase involved in cell wall biosynthesis
MATSETRRVLHVIRAPTVTGGAEKVAVDLAAGLDRSRYASTLCALGARKPPISWRIEELADAGVPLVELGGSSMKDVGAFRRYRRLIADGAYDIVHAHLWDAHVWTAIAKPFRSPSTFVAHEHTWSFEGDRTRLLIDRSVVGRRAAAFIAVSQSDARSLADRVHIPKHKIHYIPNGIDSLSCDGGTNLREELGLGDRPIVTVIAVLRAQKRFDVMIDAFVRIRARVPDACLLLVGSGGIADGYRAELERRVESLGLDDSVRFLGLRRDVGAVLDATDVACLSSDYEGLPLVLMEYMGAGKPIVATSVGGVPELVGHRKEALLVPRRDPVALGDAVVELLENRRLAQELAANARRKQAREYSLSATLRQVEALYDRLLAA